MPAFLYLPDQNQRADAAGNGERSDFNHLLETMFPAVSRLFEGRYRRDQTFHLVLHKIMAS